MTDFLSLALDLAEQGRGQTSPNPAVGSVIVRDGEIVGRGFHTWAGVKHGEIVALEDARERAQGATVYVSLEPCSHSGRTGPCADALIAAKVRKVVAPTLDPNPQVAGSGFERLRAAGIEVEIDRTHAARARRINEAFFHYMETGRPLVMLKAAVTLDGKIAAADEMPGEEQAWITSELARKHVQTLRHNSDAILTGIGTVLADDCRLTDRTDLPRSRPLLRIVIDSQLRLPPESKMVRSVQNDILAVTTTACSAERRRKLESLGVRVEVLERRDGRVSLEAIVELLAREKYLSLMIEAGSRVNWAALESGVVDKIFFYYAPKILGGVHSVPVIGGKGVKERGHALRFQDVQVHHIAPDEFAVEAWCQRER